MRIRLLALTVVWCVVAACGSGSEPVPVATTKAPASSATSTTTELPSTTTTWTTTSTAPPTTVSTTTITTEPPDAEPPFLEVTWPTPETPVDERVIRFEGRTEPGASVMAAGRYDAEVSPSGDWSIVLVLNPGGNVATFTATDAAGNTTEVRQAVHYQPPLVLRHDGLGAVSFGEPVDSVMAVLTDLLGPPDWEEIQISADIDRSVRWDKPHLYLQFTYWNYFDAAPADPLDPMPEGPVFHYYSTGSSLLTTESSITVGSSAGDLQSAYPHVRFSPVSMCEDEMWSFEIDHHSGWGLYRLFGTLNGDPDDPATHVLGLGSGNDRTPC
jgi:hypothetical protein